MNAARSSPRWPAMVSTLSAVLDGVPAETMDLFDALFTDEPPIHRGHDLAWRFNVSKQKIDNRFARAGLPTPRKFIIEALLVRAAYLLEDPHVSIASAADDLGFPSQQALHRLIALRTGCTGKEYRLKWTGKARFDWYVAHYITAHKPALCATNLVGRRRYVPVEPKR